MAVAFRAKTLTGGNTGTEPTGTAADDILIVAVYWENNATITAPAGWSNVFGSNTIATQLMVGNSFSNWSTSWHWIRRGASAPALAWSLSAGSVNTISMLCYSGAINSGNPFSFAAKAARDDLTVATYPSVSGTTDQANEMLVWFGSQLAGNSTFVPPTGYTIRENSAGFDIAAADLVQASAGAVTASGASGIGGNDNTTAFLAGLSPTTVGGGGATFVPQTIVIPRQAVQRASRW